MINHIPCQNRRIMILVTAILSGFLLFAASGSEAMDLDNRVEKFVLSNGLTVLVMERHMSPTTALYIRYKVGAAYEQAGETGMAHFLEHMMFKGTTTIGAKHPEEERTILFRIKTLGELIDRERQKKDGGEKEKIAEWQAQMDDLQAQHRELRIPNEMDRLYTENGAEYFNANTSQDMTTYLVSLPANKTELWARIESDRMTNTVFRDFYVERQVVREERRQRTEANPRGALYEQFMAAAFTAHPYGRPVIGWASDMENLSEDAMTAFMKKYYIPSNTVIAVVGSVNTPDIMKQIQKYFGVIPAQPVTPPVLTREPPQNGERRVNVTWDANPTLMIGYHKPSMPHEDDYIFEFIETILTKGRTSRLHRRLVQEKGIAESVYAVNGLPGNRYPNLFVIMATPQAPHTNEKLEKLIYEELDRLAKEPVSEEELQKVKTLIRADYIRSLASNERLAEQLSYFEAMVGDYRYLTTYLDRMKTVTAADIQKAAKTYLTPENRTAATITRKDPSAKEGRHISPPTIAKAEKKESFLRKKRDAGTKAQKKKGVGTTADHLIPPEQIVYPPLDYQIPAAHNITLPSGIRLFILEDEERPLVEISVLIATGSAHDPQGREGLAELVCRSMRSAGITGTASNAVDDLLDHHAIHITTAAEMEISRFYLSVLKENLNTGMYIFSRILQSPAFEAGKVQTEKNLLKVPEHILFSKYRNTFYS